MFFNWCSNHTGRKNNVYKHPLDEELAIKHKNQVIIDDNRRKEMKQLDKDAASDEEIQDIVGDIRKQLGNKYKWNKDNNNEQ